MAQLMTDDVLDIQWSATGRSEVLACTAHRSWIDDHGLLDHGAVSLHPRGEDLTADDGFASRIGARDHEVGGDSRPLD